MTNMPKEPGCYCFNFTDLCRFVSMRFLGKKHPAETGLVQDTK